MRSVIKWAVVVLVALGGSAWAQSSGANVVSGSAGFQRNGGNLTVTTGGNRTIINWNRFGVPQGTLTHFQQPGRTAATLNRVTGGHPSGIYGTLSSNGKLYLINPNGIVVGPSGVVRTAGFVASTLDISNAEFLNGGTLNFKGDSGASVVNLGSINATGGDVYLIARHVENHGTINATGNVGLAAGMDVLLYEEGEERMFVRPVGDFVGETGVLNTGAIQAASAELKASGNMFSMAINHQGVIRATGSSTEGGRVVLRANGGAVNVGGAIAAQRVNADGKSQGGHVQVLGEVVSLDDGALLDASGQLGGGQVNIGGSFQGKGPLPNADRVFVSDLANIYADATESGNGGTVIVWADDSTVFNGFISARALGQGNGGFAEVSGKVDLTMTGLADLSATYGEAGTLLLDPGRVRIVSGNQNGVNRFGNLWIQNQLANNNLIITTDAASNGNPPDIRVLADVIWDSAFSFTLNAGRDILARRSIINNGAGAVILNAGGDVVVGGSGNDQFVSVGSRMGLTQVTGTNLIVRGSDDFIGAGAMLGVNGFEGATGDIAVNVTEDVRVLGGDAPAATAQIGHSIMSFGNVPNGRAAIGLELPPDVVPIAFGIGSSLDPANISITAGQKVIVKGGNPDGFITVTGEVGLDAGIPAGPMGSSAAQIGHSVYSGGARNRLRGDGAVNGFGDAIFGNISITSGDTVRVEGGGEDGGILNSAQIGHLMFDSFFGVAVGDESRISLDAEPVGMISGNIDIVSGGAVRVFGGAGGVLNYAMIGHGGPGGSGNINGNINVTAAENVHIHGGNGLFEIPFLEFDIPSILNYAAIGHAGMQYSGNRNGDINVTSTGGLVRVLGGEGILAHARIGHGGFGFDFTPFLDGFFGGDSEGLPLGMTAVPGVNGFLDPFGDISGDITVTAFDNVNVIGGTGILSYSQIGHFGSASNPGVYEPRLPTSLLGEFGSIVSGNVNVTSQTGNVRVIGQGLFSNAHIGHVAPDLTIPLNLIGDLLGEFLYEEFDFYWPYLYPTPHTTLSGNINVSAPNGNVILRTRPDIFLGEPTLVGELAGEDPAMAYAAIGHGDHFGLLLNGLLWDIGMDMGDEIGLGAIPFFTGDIFGDIAVTAGFDVSLLGAPTFLSEDSEDPTSVGAFAMIGHMAFPGFDEEQEPQGEFAGVNAFGAPVINGTTTIGVSLADAHRNGIGRFTMNRYGIISSGFGQGDQIRVYMPNPNSHSVETGAVFFNNLSSPTGFVSFINGVNPGAAREFFGYTYNSVHTFNPYTPIYSFYYYPTLPTPQPTPDVDPDPTVPDLTISYDDFDRYRRWGWNGEIKPPGVRNMMLFMSKFIQTYRGSGVMTGGETVGAGTEEQKDR